MRIWKWIIVEKSELEKILGEAEAGLAAYDEWVEDHGYEETSESGEWIRNELSGHLARIADMIAKLLKQ